MDKETIQKLAKQAGVRLFGSWIEGSQEALYRFAKLVVEEHEAEDVCVWPDGTWCFVDEREDYDHMSDDYQIVRVTEWDDEGEPMLPGGLR